jgi:glyoxylase-like metal-dependent hydrolase (beta-lactamase superfamily II)
MDIRAFDRALLTRGGPPHFLLDVRNPIEAARWRPEGPGLTGYLNLPYFAFVEDEDDAAARVPVASEVLVLCAKGGSSAYVADVLLARGMNASNIEGGMTAWAAHHRIEQINPQSDAFALYQAVRPAKGCLSYIIISDGEALIADSSRHIEAYQDFVDRLGARIVCVVDTHLHADHVSGGAALSNEAAAAYFLADEDAAGAAIAHSAMPRCIRIGKTPIDIVTLAVPGHTMGSTALLIDKRYLISGDTLLPDGVGRPDLGNKAREWTGLLYESLAGVLARLQPNTVVLPAHASSATHYDDRGVCTRRLGDLLAVQPLSDREGFVEMTARAAEATTQPAEYAQIRRVNLGEPATAEELESLEIGVNKCALASAGG